MPEPPETLDTDQITLYSQGVGITNEYELRQGVCVLPLAEEPPESQGELKTWSPVVVLRLHAPYRLRRVSYQTKKENNPPVVPSPADRGAFVFLGGDLNFQNGINATYRNFDWMIASDYQFVETCVSRPQDGFILGTPPWTWAASFENAANMGGIPNPPDVGAIAQAGSDAQLGVAQATQIFGGVNIGIGGQIVGWGYNTASYFPGVLFSADMINAGPPLQQINTLTS